MRRAVVVASMVVAVGLAAGGGEALAASPKVHVSATHVVSWPSVGQRTHSTSVQVRTVQYLLDARGARLTVDGAFGPMTAGATKSFQSSRGLPGTGVVTAPTWLRLVVTVSSGSSGDAVKAVQAQLNSRNLRGTNLLALDGVFGPRTAAGVRAFQRASGLAANGIVGPTTWRYLVSGYLSM